VSILASVLFLGAWNGPIPITSMLGLTAENGTLYGYLANLIGLANVLFKGVVGVSVMIWIRWTLPRLRIDQVMATCLKYCTPIAAAMFLGAVAWQYNLPGRTFFGLLAAPQTMFSVDEGWAAPPAVTTEPAKPAMVEMKATGSAGGRIAVTPSSQLVHRQSRWLQSANDSAAVLNQGREN
jgi:NADH-quinone oxidoreductase subunit H